MNENVLSNKIIAYQIDTTFHIKCLRCKTQYTIDAWCGLYTRKNIVHPAGAEVTLKHCLCARCCITLIRMLLKNDIIPEELIVDYQNKMI